MLINKEYKSKIQLMNKKTLFVLIPKEIERELNLKPKQILKIDTSRDKKKIIMILDTENKKVFSNQICDGLNKKSKDNDNIKIDKEDSRNFDDNV